MALSVRALLLAVIARSWEVGVRAFEIPTFILPAPSSVAMALCRGFASGLYLKHLYPTLLETLLGFLLGSALGFVLGTAVAHEPVRRVLPLSRTS